MKKFLPSILPGAIFAIAAPVIFYLANPNNRILLYWGDMFVPILFTLAVSFILYGISYFITHNPAAAGSISIILVLGIFYLWPIALGLVLISLVLLLALRLLRKKIDLFSINKIFFLLSVVLALFYTSQLVYFVLRLPSPPLDALIEPVISPQLNSTTAQSAPDIYYIILDGYGRSDMLKSIYGYDNSDFIKKLQNLGFSVPSASRSNYGYTELSLGSSLNMQYLDKMSASLSNTNVWWVAQNALFHNQVREFLEKKGYRTIFMATGFDYTDIRDGNEYIKPFPFMLNNFEGGYLSFTSFSLLGDMGHLISYPSYSTYRRIIMSNFEALPRVAPEAGPKFVFAHITAPHPPFVFDAAGNPINPNYPFTLSDKMREIMDIPTYKQSYANEVQFINAETIKTVTSILANSPRPPVIIIQGDHGPGLFLSNSLADACLYERFSILNAYYLPGKKSDPIPETITPVNTFRLVFNEYFSTHFDLLPDKSYYSNYGNFFQFQDISNRIAPVCELNKQP